MATLSRERRGSPGDWRGPAEVVRRWADLWSSGNLADAARVFTDDVRDHRTSPFTGIQSIEDEQRFIARVRAAFPDLRVEIVDMLADGDRVAVRAVHHGSHRGTFLGIPATGRSVVYEGTVIFRLRHEKIAERWGTVDLFGIMEQLGVPMGGAGG